MCAKLRTQFLLLSAVLSTGVYQSNGQDAPSALKENSPYSRFGMGNLNAHSNSIIRGMGGTATGYIDNFSINSFNPASYSFLRVTTLDFAIEGSNRSVLMNDKSTNSGTGSLSYLSLGIPMGKHAGLTFGMAPVSTAYYNAGDTSTNAILGKVSERFTGNGNTQLVYLGAAGKVGGFSLGVNAGYMFGSSYNSSSIATRDSSHSYISQFDRSQRMSGLYWKAGGLYNIKLKKERYVNIGATFSMSQTLNADLKERDILSLFNNNAGQYVFIDTVARNNSTAKYILPAEYSFGIHTGKTFNWDIGLDVIYTDWTKFSNAGDRTYIADNSYRLALGGEVIPDPNSRKMFSSASYRLGGYYGKDYISINGTDMNYMGFTIGASLPLKRTYTQFGRLNTALDVGRRGVIANGMARETYVKFTVGVSFNDIWFKKRKFE